ncbi:MAG TPA: helix-turn-helix transcriptional regulator [Edaphobacter sp.]|nr:helix-turn-helix transcriptional regulator [Edaphobacter sp.]
MDAQKLLKYGDGIEVAYLPSYEMQEIRTEIARFKPRLIVCRADTFLTALSDSLPRNAMSGNTHSEANIPKRLSTMLVTPRETKVLALLAQGRTNNEMAQALGLSTRTVKRTLSALFERFGASNRTELSNRTAVLDILPKGI